MLISYLAKGFLLFTSINNVVAILIVFGCAYGKRFLSQTTILLALGIIINVALKGTFRVQFPPEVNSATFAFPSGHMQFATVFYFWLALYIRKPLAWFAFLLLLPGIGFAIVYFRYHTLVDVLGGVGFGVALDLCYLFWVRKNFYYSNWILGGFASILMAYNVLVYTQVPEHAWQGYMFLVALVIADALLSRDKRRFS